MTALQKIGEKLVSLPLNQLKTIPLDPTLAEAIIAARQITHHEAKRRQLQYIGRLMRQIVDLEPVQSALDRLEMKTRQGKAHFHQIEHWRNKLITEDDNTLQELLEHHPTLDRQHLRQLVRNAKKNVSGADTELFRYLQKMLNN